MRRVALGRSLILVVLVLGASTYPPAAGARKHPTHGGGHTKKGHGKKGHGKKKHRAVALDPRLLPFDSCAAVDQLGDAEARRTDGPDYQPQVQAGGATATPVGTSDVAAGGPKKQAAAAPAGAEADFSTTNNQELAADEPDLVKTDGTTIFAVGAGGLNAIDARAANPAVIGSLPLPPGSHELLLSGTRLLVLSEVNEIPPDVDTSPDPSDPAGTIDATQFEENTAVITEVDVTDPRAMSVVASERLAGSYVSARLNGQTARIVISSPPTAVEVPQSKIRSGARGFVREARTQNFRTGTDVTAPVADNCAEIGHPATPSGAGMLTVLTVDMNKGLPAVDADLLMTDAENVYASATGLYVSTSRFLGRFRFGNPERDGTAIHRFDISAPDSTTYQASGLVRGVLLNQFSMSEFNGYLRVASTGPAIGADDAGGTEGFVTVLQPEGSDLLPVGMVGGLGKGERIQGVRLEGDKGYVVTFHQTDPLYTLDLSVPTAPRVVGQLKILGYSAYLHPIDENLLIGVGADADEAGVIQGAQISLFDVSNPKDPRRIAHHTIPGGRSVVEDDHHAFLYWPPARLAVMPVTGARVGKGRFSGAFGFRVGGGKIGEVGTITHRAVVKRGEEIDRSLVVGDRLFTLSCRGLGVSALADLRPQAWLPFTPASPRACSPALPIPLLN